MSKNVIFSILALIFVSTGCAKMPIYNSEWNGKQNQPDQVKVGQYDREARLGYNVLNDHKRLYISLETADPLTQAKILRHGVKIFVNTSGKKDKTTFLLFPDSQTHVASMFRHNQSNNFKNHEKRLKQTISRIYKEGQWHNNSETTVVTPSKGTNGFKLILNADSVGYLNYKVGIPLSDIKTSGNEDSSNITIGIHIDGFKKSKSKKSHQNSEQGEYGGEAGEGAEGGEGSFGSESNGPMTQLSAPINIWFQTKLASK